MRSIKAVRTRQLGSTTLEASSTIYPTTHNLIPFSQSPQIRSKPHRRSEMAATRPHRMERHVRQQHGLRRLPNRSGMLPRPPPVVVPTLQPVLRSHAPRRLGELFDGRCTHPHPSRFEVSARNGADPRGRVHEWECAELSRGCYG